MVFCWIPVNIDIFAKRGGVKKRPLYRMICIATKWLSVKGYIAEKIPIFWLLDSLSIQVFFGLVFQCYIGLYKVVVKYYIVSILVRSF